MATKKQYEGHVIKIDEHYTDMRFEVSGPLFEKLQGHQRTFESYAAATEEIDKRMKVAVKQKNTNLSLDVLKHDGSGTTTIKGIHGRLGNLLFTDGDYSKRASESYSGIQNVYPNVPWIKELLLERIKLEKRVADIGNALKNYRIKVDYSSGYRLREPEYYGAEIDKLIAEHAEKLSAARKTNDQGQAA